MYRLIHPSTPLSSPPSSSSTHPSLLPPPVDPLHPPINPSTHTPFLPSFSFHWFSCASLHFIVFSSNPQILIFSVRFCVVVVYLVIKMISSQVNRHGPLTWFPASRTVPGVGLGRYGIVAPFGGDWNRSRTWAMRKSQSVSSSSVSDRFRLTVSVLIFKQDDSRALE